MDKNENITYEVWVLGYDEEDNVTDYEQHIATFTSEKVATWFMNNYEFEKPKEVPNAKAVLEQVVNRENSSECVDLLMETEL